MAILSKNTLIGGKKPLLLDNTISSKSINLNDYTTEGHYIFNNLTTVTNFPSSITWTRNNASHLQVFSYDNSKVIQILMKYNTNYIFMRTSYLSGENTNWNSWQKIWNAGNDGNGSGLDADTIDSLQATAFPRLYNKTINNFNSATNVGFYCINGSINAPTTGSLWGCIVFSTDISSSSTSSSYLFQIAVKDNTSDNTMYIRKKIGSGWTAWNTIGDMSKSVYDKDNDGVIDDVVLMEYYGTKDITISPESYFTVNSTGETITGLTDTGKTQTELVIPYKINGIKITVIDSNAFRRCTSLTAINIPNSITTINKQAFYECSSLQSINIPSSITAIESHTFYKCTLLKSVDIPNSVTIINSYAFGSCMSLSSIDIPNSVTTIDRNAFEGCRALKSIDIPNSVTEIGNDAFYNCASLKSINIPNSIISVGYSIFADCKSLITINIPDSVTKIWNAFFAYCSSLISINIPNSVTTIDRSAFEGCTSLKLVKIPSSVTTIADNAFHIYDRTSETYSPISGLTIYCEQGSYAETYAKENNIPVIYTEIPKNTIDNIIGNTTVTSLPIKNGNYIFTTSDIESLSNEYALNVVYIDSNRYVYTATNIETGKIFIKTANTVWTKVNNVTSIES